MQDLDGQVAIVTGGGRGVGRAVAEALGARGAAVAVAARTISEIEAVAAALSRAIAVPTDVTRAEQVGALVERTGRELGPPTLLVAGAGTWDHVGPAWEGDADAWWRDVEVAVRGAYLCARAVLPGMVERGAGRIVVLSSYAANVPRPWSSGYGSGRAALLRFIDSLAGEVEERGVAVFAVSPGFVRTELVENVIRSEAGRRYLPELGERTDALAPELAGELVAELATGRADALTGRFLHVLDDLDDLVARADEIRANDLYALRFRRY
ncbi:MAG: SDR family oxidoreductase [Actinobacteria bacterium]|nr:MAG: SDR family oxidoreductase [Actinomycetota bacterium]